jgi:hypothetical protein
LPFKCDLQRYTAQHPAYPFPYYAVPAVPVLPERPVAGLCTLESS